MISVEDALQNILDSVAVLGMEKSDILSALGRVIGEDIYSGRNIPPKDNSAMDGYAVRSADTFGASDKKPVMLEVIEELPAGSASQKTIGKGQAARIMTGAFIPEGADAVIPVEDTEKENDRAAIFVSVQAGRDIRFAGEDVKLGEKVIAKGEILSPAHIGMLASLGRSFVLVHQKPLIAIVSSGDELADIDEPPSLKIVSSNSYSLAALVLECGAIPMQMGIAKDRREDLLEKFRAAMRADLIISSGGVSVGDFDLVKNVMKQEGNRMQFWQVAMKPGKPLAFGALEDVPIIGLPGNPVSSMVSFEQFARPAILKMMGHKNLFRKTIQVRLSEDINKKPGKRHFIRAIIEQTADGYAARTTGDQGSGILTSMVQANGLIIMPPESTKAKAGEFATVQPLDNSLQMAADPGYPQS
ncbi:MAG: molybdopterin molybdotransferase MoeA [Syntrophales bacterium]|nr:molybdopterin molybdotransferase MoeA [Syntrophales bacterium]